MAAAVIEFYALPDAVRTAAENHDFFLFRSRGNGVPRLLRRRSRGEAGTVVSRVEIRRERLEFRRAGVDEIVARREPDAFPRGENVRFRRAEQVRDLPVGKAEAFRLQKQRGISLQPGERSRGLYLVRERRQLLEFPQKPAVDPADFMHFVDGPPARERRSDGENAVRRGETQRAFQSRVAERLRSRVLPVGAETVAADFERAQPFLKRFLERAADRHRFADGFHLRAERRIRAGKFLESEAGNFRDDVVDRRFEARRRAPRDVVEKLVEREAHGELRRDFRNGKPRRLRRERGRARDARIHLDDDHPPVFRIQRELHVRSAGVDADFPHHGERGVAHPLVLAGGQRQRGSDRDRVARVNAHRVEIFDGANDDAVPARVAHELHFVFFPALDGFLDQHLARRRTRQSARDDFVELRGVARDPAAGPAEREARANHQREPPELVADAPRLLERMRGKIARHVQADFPHRFAECAAVFRLADDVGLCADHFRAAARKRSSLVQLHREVERGLPAERGQNRVRAFPQDDFLDAVRRQRLDVGAVRRFRIGHDRRRIGIDEHDFVAFLAQRLAGLHARVIELAALPDDDRSRADDEDFLDVCAFRHFSVSKKVFGFAVPAAAGARPRFLRKKKDLPEKEGLRKKRE